ncbi:Oidioi.mRNA.OKI2018_I69.PAR.g9497.t1.cds [Oikopleura dioica]|uniref:Oidioi.mRNA.OKI2018_I69.PAR.g9497.t1.cds n=1 Tax=Oikopleura dioica TaxID=34765 RepID=A0ABN7RRR1_OIKDI|nr:Oidioi.mRNA.OKI2018_I69.PAR.g9497.t1.cds [Oikopleura dioica]
MKIAWTLAALASARGLGEEEDQRIWSPDLTEAQITQNLQIGETFSWSVPVFPDGNGDPRYLPNQYYRIYVTVPENTAVKLSFGAVFDVEEPGITNQCTNDAAIVFNGPDGNYELGRYCGNSLPEPVFGTRQDMTLVFKTNENSVVHEGFTATFEVIDLEEHVISWNLIHNAFEDLKSEIFEGHDHKRDHIQDKKAIHFQRIYNRFAWMSIHSRSDGQCAVPAVPTSEGFIPPTSDYSDPCYAIGNFIHSIRSFHAAYVCQDNIPMDAENRRKIPSKTLRMLKTQEDNFTNKKFHAMGCLL